MDVEALKEELKEYQLLQDEIVDDNSKTLVEVWAQPSVGDSNGKKISHVCKSHGGSALSSMQ